MTAQASRAVTSPANLTMSWLPVSRWTALWLFVVACVVLIAAFVGSSFVQGTDAFRAALAGAAVGGAFALLGGLAGAVYVGAKDDEREQARDRRDLIGAVREVRNELGNVIATTGTFLKVRDEHGDAAVSSVLQGVANQPGMDAAKYSAHSFRLARDLLPAAQASVDSAYTKVAFLRQAILFAVGEAPPFSQGFVDAFSETRDTAIAAHDALTAYLTEHEAS